MIKFNNEMHKMAAASYSGEGIQQYLAPFKRESPEKLKDRRSITSYDNLIKPIVDSLVDPIFGMGIKRVTEDSILNAYWIDTNRLKDDIKSVMKDVAIGYTLHGNGFLITDNFTEFTSDTKEQQAKDRELPWTRYRDMTELYAYDLDSVDNITSLEFYNGLTENRKQKIIGYDSTNVYKYIVGENTRSIIPHGLTEMPVIALNGIISENPTMKDLCQSNISLFNKQSELRNFERDAAWVILDLPTNNDIDTILLKQFNVMRTDPESSRGLNFVSPDSNVLSGLQSSVELATNNIENQASRMGSVASKTSSQSGEALKMEFLGQSYKLKDLSRKLETIENESVKLVESFVNYVFEYLLEYPLDFVDPAATKSADIDVLQKAVDLVNSMKESGIIIPEELKTYITDQLRLITV